MKEKREIEFINSIQVQILLQKSAWKNALRLFWEYFVCSEKSYDVRIIIVNRVHVEVFRKAEASHWRCFFKKFVLKNVANLTGLRPATILKRDLNTVAFL